jgi:hypothetical protein
MPYQKSDANLDKLVKRILQDSNDPEISNGIKKAQISERDVYSEIRKNASEIWDVVTEEIQRYDEKQNNLNAVRADINKELGPFPTAPLLRNEATWIRLPIGALLIIAISWIVREGYRNGFRVVMISLVTLKGLFWIAGLFVLLAILTYLNRALSRRRLKKRTKQRDDALHVAISEWTQKQNKLQNDRSTAVMYRELNNAQQAVEQSVIEKRIKPRLRELINSQLELSYATTLKISEARGLAEVFDPQMAIDTSARNKLRFMLENMPGGSIGIAGPRGSGKTTLLRLICGPKRILTELKGKPVLGVLVSAPVAYQARDFILYLFSAVCQCVLEAEGEKHILPVMHTVSEIPESFGSALVKLLAPLPRVCVLTGTVLVLLSLLLTLVLALAPMPSGKSVPAGAADSPVASQPPLTQQSRQPTVAIEPQSAQSSQPVGQSVPDNKQAESEKGLLRFLRILQLSPGTILLWGVALVVTGLIVRSLLGHLPHSVSRMQLTTGTESVVPEKAEEDTGKDSSEEQQTSAVTLKSEAFDWLKRIKFQQSYTSGWSGTLKLPVALEGGVNNAITLAENQLSLPEIVHFFVKFIELASEKYQVIIGIDELDKLETDEKARLFLNDIKSIFGLERCFYLVSVSENAMSSFERRGLPFRDVFDSSFDNILYVDYLTFESAKSLLEQRVVGRPIPFFGLSYSLSGGLARDLIRDFRSIIEFRQNSPTANDLESICRAVVQADLKAKFRAAAISAKNIDLEPDGDIFLEELYGLERQIVSDISLLECARQMLKESSHPAVNDVDKNVGEKRAALCELREELATYVYHATTILQFFNNGLSETAFTQPKAGGSMDDLARARQILSVNSRITRAMLDTFRSAQNLNGLLMN